MALKDTIAQDMKDAMRSGNKVELEALRSIRAGILEYEKREVGYTLTPDDELALLTSAAKKRKDAIEQYTLGNRPELADAERQELEVIQRYLPKQMTDDEIKSIVSGIIEATGVSDAKGMGRIMGEAMKQLKGKADGSTVQRIVKELLGGE